MTNETEKKYGTWGTVESTQDVQTDSSPTNEDEQMATEDERIDEIQKRQAIDFESWAPNIQRPYLTRRLYENSKKGEKNRTIDYQQRMVSLPKEVWIQAEKVKAFTGCRNMDTFIEGALNFFGGYAMNEEYGDYMPTAVGSVIRATLHDELAVVASGLFQYATEAAMLRMTLVKDGILTEEEMEEIRTKATREAQSIRGSVQLDGRELWQNKF